MQVPVAYNDDILDYEKCPFPDEPVHEACVYSLVYPPVGFFPFYGIGNGDYHGFYWPLGKEQGEPLVAFTSHYVGSVIPESSDIERFYLCQLATGNPDDPDYAEGCEPYRALAEKATGRGQPARAPIQVSDDGYRELLELDPESPFLLAAVGDQCLQSNDPASAVDFYTRAVSNFPEYVAAHFGLVLAYRRLRQADNTVRHLRETLLNPPAFCGASWWAETCLPGGTIREDWQAKSLNWLQRAAARLEGPLADDPFIRAVSELRFETGVRESPDFAVFERLIDAYVSRGQPLDAIRVWTLYAVRAAWETTSLRERLGITPRVFAARLIELLEVAGLLSRVALVRDMLGRMEKPDGLYL